MPPIYAEGYRTEENNDSWVVSGTLQSSLYMCPVEKKWMKKIKKK